METDKEKEKGPTGTNSNIKIPNSPTGTINNMSKSSATGTTGTNGSNGSNGSTGTTGTNSTSAPTGTNGIKTQNNSTGTNTSKGNNAAASANKGNNAAAAANKGNNAAAAANKGNNAAAAANKGNNAATDSEDLPFYHYTQSKFWGGPTTNWTILRVLSIFPLTGLLGLDHIYLRSPFSALLKTIFNILTFGLWYFYDMAQVLGEPERVKKFGMSYPVVGPVGLGAGIFLPEEEEEEGKNGEKKNNNNEEKKPGPPSPLTFLLYCIFAILPLPFALDHFVVGDVKGGIAKVFANFNIFLFIFSIFWTLFTLFRMTFQTEKMMKEGIIRFFPFTLFMEPIYCPGTKLGPKEECEVEPVSGSMSFMDFFKSIFATLRGIPVLGGIMGAVDKLKEVYDQYVPPVIGAGVAMATLAPKVAVGVTQKLAELGDTDKIMKQASSNTAPETPPKQSGGSYQTADNGSLSIFLLIAFAGIAFMGVFLAKLRDMEVLDVLPKSIHSILRRRINSSTVWSSSTGPNDTPPGSAAI